MPAQWKVDPSADWYAELVESKTKPSTKAKKPRQVWHWHIVAANGENVCTSGEPFYSEDDCREACADFLAKISGGGVQAEIR